MLRASSVVRRVEMAGRIAIDTITLDREARYRRRIAMTTDRGHAFLLDLAEATYLAHGDALEIEGRGLVKVVAAPEELAGPVEDSNIPYCTVVTGRPQTGVEIPRAVP